MHTMIAHTLAPNLHELLAPEMAAMDRLIHQLISNPLSLIPEVARHLLLAGGKRLRPLLTIACAKLFSEQPAHINQAISLAAAIEFMHNATLLHDDVVDLSSLRRGKQTVHTLWGNSISILVGDFLFTQAFQLTIQAGNLKILELLCKTSQQIVEGEVSHLQCCTDLAVASNTLLAAMGNKTATLFAASCKLGGLAVGLTDDTAQLLYDYGYAFGMAFQLRDDLDDYLSNQRGKNQGEDFLSGKITMPVLLAYQRANLEDQQFLIRTIVERHTHSTDLTRAIALVKQNQSATLELIKLYQEKALTILKTLPDNHLSRALRNLIL